MFKSSHRKISLHVRVWKNIGTLGLFLSMLVAIFAAQVSAQSLNYTTSWLGNSYGGTSPASATPNQHVQDDIMGLYVAPSGACCTDSTWDENGMPDGSYGASIYNTNNSHSLDGRCVDLGWWGRFGGKAVTSDGTYLYVGITQSGDDDPGQYSPSNNNYPPPNTIWYAVRRYHLDGTTAPFPGGWGYDGTMLVVAQGSRPAPGPNQPAKPYTGSQLAGLAAASGCLYVSDPNSNQVLQYSITNNGPARTTLPGFNVNSSWTVGAMTAAASPGGPFLWVNENNSGDAGMLTCYSLSGSQVAGTNLPTGAIPSALAYNSANNALYVADAGPDQNIKVFSLTSSAWSTPFGVKGGQFDAAHAAPGTAGPQRFNNITGLGIDAAGNLYVAEDQTCFFPSTAGSGGSVLESYSLASGSRNWERHGLTFIDCADIDPATGADAYTKDKHFTMNWGSTAPGTEASYAGYTLDRFKYPQDLRLHLGAGNASEAWVRKYVDSSHVTHKFLITHDMYASTLGIFRFNPSTDGGIAIPSVVFSQHNISQSAPAGQAASGWPEGEPSSGEWLWTFTGFSRNDGTMNSGTYQANPDTTFNANSFGWWVDDKMNVWQALQGPPNGQTYCIREWVCQGLDSIGNPIYSYSDMNTYPIPSVPSGSPTQQGPQRIEYHAETDTMYLGGYSSANPNSSGEWGLLGSAIYRYDHWSTKPTLHPGYPIALPYSHSTNPGTIAGSMSITGSYVFVVYSYHNQILVYSANTGKQVGTITPGSTVGGTGSNEALGWDDIRNAVRAYRRANGQYEIFNEDDTYAKVVMYRWTPFVQHLKR